MNNTIASAFKKLLGNGRAWITPKGFTSDLMDLLISPFEELKNRFISLKFVHFPSTLIDENNIKNGEELFSIKDFSSKNLEERAANVEGQWNILAGSQNFKQIEQILQKKGFPVRVIENIPDTYNKYGARNIGNGYLKLNNGEFDPIVITDGKNSFIIQADDFISDEAFLRMVDTVVKCKPAQLGIYYIPRFLRKKEIHRIMTKSQMQNYKKSQYCDCRRQNGY